MRWAMVRLLLTTSLVAWQLYASATSDCSPLTGADEARLAAYVVRRYEIPVNVKIRVKSFSVLDRTCYRKVLFAGDGPLGEVSVAMYVSPDLRYLSPELFDSSVAPEREREENAQRVLGQLTEGEYATIGDANAPVTVVVFSDFECPFCRRAAEILRAEPLIREGNAARLVFRHMPLSRHPWALTAAQAAACAQFQSALAFWAFHDGLFQAQPKITEQNLSDNVTAIAAGIPRLDRAKFKECVDRQMSIGVVLRDKDLAQRLGVGGTPSIFVDGRMIPWTDDAAGFHELLETAVRNRHERNEVQSPAAGRALGKNGK